MNNEDEASYAAKKLFGEEGSGSERIFDPIVYQGNEGVCAIRSQQIILRDYGIDVSLEELKQFAIDNGWYDGNGTPMGAIGFLLQSCNVPCEQSVNNTVYDIVNELAQGHRVIVGVDANELWADRNGDIVGGAKEWFRDFFQGDTPNHALVVAGVEVNPNNPEDVKVILTDPGTGDLRIEYELSDFMDAWEDSQCFMVSTNTPAPLQYDPETGCEVPSNFAVTEYINTNSIPLNPHNVILPGEMAAKCASAYYSEGHLNQINVDGKDIDFEDYAKSVETAQKYKSYAGGGQFFGQDHFDAKAFSSALKGLLGLNSDKEDKTIIQDAIEESEVDDTPDNPISDTDDASHETNHFGDDSDPTNDSDEDATIAIDNEYL